MSSFGAHVSSGRRDGFGAALLQCAEAGSPVPVLVSLDQDLWPDVAQYSPDTVVVFRTQPDGDDNPIAMYTGDPVVVARDWYNLSRPRWLLNHAHYYAPCNERNPVLFAAQQAAKTSVVLPDRNTLLRYAMALPLTSAQNTWLDDFDFEMMLLAEVDGFRLALHGDSVGTPDYPAWQYYRKSLSHAAANGHVLLLHEYGLETTLQNAGPDLALRYRRVHDIIEPFAPGLKMVIGETSSHNGYSGEGAAWLNDCAWYDSEAMKDARYLIGFAGYQLGGAENWYRLIQQWADYVATHPTPEDIMPVNEFLHSHLDGGAANTANPISITMNASHTLVGDFQTVKYFLTTSVTPIGAGSWVLDPPQPADGYPAGTVVMARAVPA